jgi:bifunctional non-homologous end joining protein LigD
VYRSPAGKQSATIGPRTRRAPEDDTVFAPGFEVSLRDYVRKRDFHATPEPRGQVATRRGARAFVVQKHAASQLHYDFRLELEGVLKSWSVPKGPSLDPSTRRLAMQTEDHPTAYGDFEGIIPKGQYGGGTVLLWDHGTWTPLDDDPHKAFRAGKLRFRLAGEKLRGAFVLERKATGRGKDDARAWVLTKEKDRYARVRSVTDERPESVATGRALEEIAADEDRVWNSNRATPLPDRAALRGAKPGAFPKKPWPIVAPRRAAKPPAGDAWIHEVRYDGLRVVARLEDGDVRLFHRGEDVTARFPRVARALVRLPVRRALVDGVVAALLPDGTTRKEALEDALARGATREITFFAFDLLYLDDADLRGARLEDRKARLQALLEDAHEPAALRYSAHVAGQGRAFYDKGCELGLAAIVSKRRASRYDAKAKSTWVECACATAKPVRPARGASPEGLAISARPSPKTLGKDIVVEGVKLTHPDRLLYPRLGVTKEGLAAYWVAIAEHALPHVLDRPLTLVRCPDGADKPCAYMRHSKVWGPSFLRRVSIREKEKLGEYLVVDDVAGLVSLVQMGVVEVHTWNSNASDLERPSRVVFDLDPDPAVSWRRVAEAAREVKEHLASLGFESFVKTTGGKGLHVVVPLVPAADWGDCFAFTRAVAAELVRSAPDAFTTTMPKARRRGKILIDYLRNNRGNTSVAAYSPRARPNAPVSTPITWAELDDLDDPGAFTLETIPARLRAQRRDPWRGYGEARQRITRPTTQSGYA